MQIRSAAEMPLPPRRSMRRRIVVVALLSALLSAVYTGWWLSAAAGLRDGALSWIEHRRAEGFRFDIGAPTTAGFPFSVGVSFPDTLAALPRAAWNWRSQDVRVSVPVIGPRVLTVSLRGKQTLTLPPSTAGGEGDRLTGGADSLAIIFDPADDGALGRLAAHQLTMTGARGDGFGIGTLDLFVSQPPPEGGDSTGEVTGGVTLAATDVRLPVAAEAPLGPTVARIELKARLIGNLGRSVDAAALAAWRDEGGIVEIDRLDCDYGPVNIEADGTLALDRRGQPIGALATRVQGWQAALDSLVAAEALPSYTAAAAKILLRGLTHGNGQGGRILAAPLSLQDQALSLGPVRLFYVPDVHWLDPRSR